MNCKILLLVSIRERERGRERERERESGSVEDGGGREPSTIAGVRSFSGFISTLRRQEFVIFDSASSSPQLRGERGRLSC